MMYVFGSTGLLIDSILELLNSVETELGCLQGSCNG